MLERYQSQQFAFNQRKIQFYSIIIQPFFYSAVLINKIKEFLRPTKKGEDTKWNRINKWFMTMFLCFKYEIWFRFYFLLMENIKTNFTRELSRGVQNRKTVNFIIIWFYQRQKDQKKKNEGKKRILKNSKPVRYLNTPEVRCIASYKWQRYNICGNFFVLIAWLLIMISIRSWINSFRSVQIAGHVFDTPLSVPVPMFLVASLLQLLPHRPILTKIIRELNFRAVVYGNPNRGHKYP